MHKGEGGVPNDSSFPGEKRGGDLSWGKDWLTVSYVVAYGKLN